MKTVALGEVVQINPRASKLAPDVEVNFVGMADLDAEGARTQSNSIRPFDEVSKGYTVFEDGDILVAKITPCFENNKIGKAQLQRKFGVGSTEFHVLRPGPDVHDGYLLYFLRQQRIRRQGEMRMTGSAGQRRVPAAFLEAIPFPLPPLDEQRRIAAILDHADALRTKRRRSITKLEELTQSTYHEMFEGRSWPVMPLAGVVREGTIVTYGIVQAGEEFEGGVPYIRTGDIVGGQIATQNLRRTDPVIAAKFERSRVRTGDIVMSIRATVGTTAVVPAEIDGANLTQGTARIAPGAHINARFLLGYLRSETAQRWIQAQVKGATFREITLSRLRELPVPLPPVGDQSRYAERMARIESCKVVASQALHSSQDLFYSLQSRAFRGAL